MMGEAALHPHPSDTSRLGALQRWAGQGQGQGKGSWGREARIASLGGRKVTLI